MKNKITLDKQRFAKLYLHLAANYVKFYHYDTFYDLPRLRNAEIGGRIKPYWLYFRQSGSNILEDVVDSERHKTYLASNDICLWVAYVPNKDGDSNKDKYKIEIQKDENHFLDFFNV